jgi:hypothetical protein
MCPSGLLLLIKAYQVKGLAVVFRPQLSSARLPPQAIKTNKRHTAVARVIDA